MRLLWLYVLDMVEDPPAWLATAALFAIVLTIFGLFLWGLWSALPQQAVGV